MSAFPVFPMSYKQKTQLAGIIRGLSEPPSHGNHRWALEQIAAIRASFNRAREAYIKFLGAVPYPRQVNPMVVCGEEFRIWLEAQPVLPIYAMRDPIEVKPFPGVFRGFCDL